MADVYLGQTQRGQLFAIKTIKPDPDGVLADRFRRETEAAMRVHGKYIAALRSMNPDASPPWLATEYVPGPPLRRSVSTSRPWPVASVRALTVGLCEALISIHRSGVVHRDLTPNNVLLLADGPRVIDFGISRVMEATTTLTGRVFGTPGYIAPEHLANPIHATPASDVYALGALLCFALTGAEPEGDGQGGPRLDLVPEPMRSLVEACLAHAPRDRPRPEEILHQVLPAGVSATSMFDGVWLPAAVLEDIQRRNEELNRLLSTPVRVAGPRTVADPARTRPLNAYAAAETVVEPGVDSRPSLGSMDGSPLRPSRSPDAPPRGGSSRRRTGIIGAAAAIALLVAGTVAAIGAVRSSTGGGGMAPASPRPSASTIRPGGADPYPCRPEARSPEKKELGYRCPMIWEATGVELTEVPMFATYTVSGLTESDAVDHLVKRTGSPQYFACHVKGAQFDLPGQHGMSEAHHDWWALSQGDKKDVWGFVPEVYLWGGPDFLPDPGMPLCTESQLALVGLR